MEYNTLRVINKSTALMPMTIMACMQLPFIFIFHYRNKICYAEDNNSYMSNMCSKEFSDPNFNHAVIGKI